MTRPAILAVDGGGSKTEVALVDARGELLGAARRSGGWETHGSNGGSDSLDLAVAAACRDAGIDPADGPIARLGVYCLSLVDLAVDERRVTAEMAARGLTDERLVRNDTFAVMRAGTERSWGVGVVCGAGINCVGVAPNGRTVRFPALGLISGDWGGGYWVGMGALGAAIRGRDGRGPRTSLETAVPEHFGLARPAAVMEELYLHRMPESRVLELAPIVFERARRGDAVARGLIDRLAAEVVAMAASAIRRLRMARLDVEVVLGGGLFLNRDERLLALVRTGLAAIAPRVRVATLVAPPVVGAALLGLDRMGAGRAAQDRLRAALTHERLRAGSRAASSGGKGSGDGVLGASGPVERKE